MIEKRVLELQIGGYSKLIATKTIGKEGISLEAEIRDSVDKNAVYYTISMLGLEDFVDKIKEWRQS